MKRKPKPCDHLGPYRVVQAVGAQGTGIIVVVCQGCGGYQEPARSLRPSDRWLGTEPDITAFPEDIRLLVRAKPTMGHAEAHAEAVRLDLDRAVQRHDGGRFLWHGQYPPWWETKYHETSGDILYREKAGWTAPPPAVDPEDVWADA